MDMTQFRREKEGVTRVKIFAWMKNYKNKDV